MTDDPTVLDRLERPWVAVGLCVAVYLPFTLLGYGSDIDVWNVLDAGRTWLDEGTYSVSRTPGSAIHEVSTAFLDDIGGSLLVNVVSLLFAGLALWGVYELLRREGSRIAGLSVIVLATNPWFWIASTSLGDFVWALGLLMAGAVAARRDHRMVAGLLFALGVGCRLSTVFLVLAWLLAERLGDRAARPSWRATLLTGGVALAVAVLCFIPSWESAGRTFEFLDSHVPFDGLGPHLGRSVVKNVAFLGVIVVPVLLFGIPHLLRSLSSWHSSVAFRFAVFAFVAAEVLYLRYPFKITHLLPVAVALALVVGHFGVGARRWIVVLIAAQLLSGIVTTTIGSPDVEDRSTGGRISLGLTAGPLLTDVRCRLQDLDDGGYEDGTPEESARRAIDNAACLLKTWRAEPSEEA